MQFCSYVKFLLRNCRKTDLSYGADLVGNMRFIWHKKKWLVAAQNLQIIKTLLTLELSQYHKSGSTFSQSEPVAASSNFCQLGNSLCLCLPARTSQAVQECCPRALHLILQSKYSIDFWNSMHKWLPDDLIDLPLAGLKLGLKFEVCRLTNGLWRFFLLWSPKINCVEC